ncbi:hypothetical protein PVK06_005402 [Gossypium arboreum]|uniref:Uncharacterized protein n=1 Tax=Gossypium arboreum TaxID=29729 RepID=A0ABR0QVU6_GOSAR|nr:hypothetical protein PVK06_005402 [Gossypium arboreum]
MPSSESLTEAVSMVVDETGEKSDGYDPWMLVEKRSRKKSRDSANSGSRITEKKNEGSRLMALIEKESNVVIKSGKNEEIQDTRQRKGKETVIEGNQGAGAGMYNVSHFSSRSRDTINVLGLKNVAGPSKSSNNAGGLDNGLVSSSNLVIDPRTTFNGAFKGLRGSSLLKDSTSGQENRSNSGPGENKIMAVPDRVMEVSGKLIRNLVAYGNQGRIADGGNDGSDSHSHIAGDGNKSENME